MKKKTKKAVRTAAALAGALAIGFGASYAYYTSTPRTVQNQFSLTAGQADVPNGGGEIHEPEWDPDDPTHKDMYPSEILSKNPYFESTSNYDGWIVMKVEIPTISAVLRESDLIIARLLAMCGVIPLCL